MTEMADPKREEGAVEQLDLEAASKAGGWTPDRDLVQWTLSLSLEERLAVLQDFVDTFWTPVHG